MPNILTYMTGQALYGAFCSTVPLSSTQLTCVSESVSPKKCFEINFYKEYTQRISVRRETSSNSSTFKYLQEA